MNHRESINGLSEAKRLSIKHILSLTVIWFFISALLLFSRIAHPAFGVQGDLPIHYHYVRSYERSFSEGDIFPRWAGLLDGGRGDALFTFYPPLSFLLSLALIKFLGVDALTSLKIGSLLIMTIAQASAYLFARQFFTRRQSLTCSLIYALLPAYPLIALHRAFLANAVALSILPLSLLGASLLLGGERRARGFAIFAVSFSALILTHAITTYLCAMAIGLMALIYLPTFGWRGILRLAGAGAATLAFTAFFLWPQRVESSWVQINLQTVQQSYRNYFLFAKSPDGSAYWRSWAEINHVASLVTLAQSSLALLLGLMCRKALSPRKAPIGMSAAAWFGLGLTAMGLLISLPISDALWRYLPGLKFVQFPWRFQPLVALGCGLLAATLINVWPTLNPKSRMRALAFLTWIVIFCAILTYRLIRLDEADVTRSLVSRLFTATDAPPINLKEAAHLQNEDDLKNTMYAANQLYFRPAGSDYSLYPPTDQPGGVSIVSGKGNVVSQKLANEHREFLIDSQEPIRARIETYYYPHWVARLDGWEINIDKEQGSGLMLVDLPKGSHRLTFNYEVRQASQRAAWAISFTAWGGFLLWMIARGINRLKLRRTSVR
jgi:hypothetical protein